jgi:hypothetical protein
VERVASQVRGVVMVEAVQNRPVSLLYLLLYATTEGGALG